MTGTTLLGARRLRELLDLHGIRPTKSLGQNFVIDPNTIRKVVEVANLGSGDHVLEIGAGAGSLTLGLADAAGRVVALEYDRRLLPVLNETLGSVANVEVVHGDALEVDLAGFGATKVVANLPYNIAASVVLKVLEAAPGVESLTVMTQREVGERLAAAPGSKTYGQPSVLVAYFAAARVAAQISRRVFYPEPNVDSVLVRIDRRAPPEGSDHETFAALVRAGFSQRRKSLRNSLAPLVGSPARAEGLLEAAGIDPGTRAERLPLDRFVALEQVLRASGE
jgi:16S rRNA (adenine1518-N6/adenine1519-N6)-dimethyltransferase